ncbi:MAG: hypothetical protein R2784_09450 [Saprospiraceae bacterium]
MLAGYPGFNFLAVDKNDKTKNLIQKARENLSAEENEMMEEKPGTGNGENEKRGGNGPRFPNNTSWSGKWYGKDVTVGFTIAGNCGCFCTGYFFEILYK